MRSAFSFTWSSCEFTTEYKTQSSTYNRSLEILQPPPMLFITSKKSNSTEPWRTPDTADRNLEESSLDTTYCCRDVRYVLGHVALQIVVDEIVSAQCMLEMPKPDEGLFAVFIDRGKIQPVQFKPGNMRVRDPYITVWLFA